MPKLSSEEMDKRRGRVVAAARTCFSRDGFSDCSMDEICEEAGLSKGAVYNHFASKEELIYAVADEQFLSLERLTGGKSLDEIRDSLLELFVSVEGEPGGQLEIYAMSRAITDEGLRTRMSRNIALIEQSLDSALARLEASGQVRLRTSRERTREILLTFLQGVFSRRLMTGRDRVREDFALLIDMVLER